VEVVDIAAALGASGRTPRLAVVVLTALVLVLTPSDASAGRLLATGHDADLHCAPGPATREACTFMRAAVTYVRGAAPDVTLPVLVVDRPPGQAGAALSIVGVPYVVVTPEALPATIDTSIYSAVVVASDSSCTGCDINPPPGAPDSALLATKAPALLRFFNDGGGLLALAGAANAGAYYDVLPLPVGGRPAAAPPYAPAPAGVAIGLSVANTNCCIAHNSFAPAPSLTVAETDGLGRPETLLADGEVRPDAAGAPTLTAPAATPAGLDPFKCYSLGPATPAGRGVSLRDRFGTQRVTVRAPRQLCNPVAITTRGAASSPHNPRAHLTCYGISEDDEPLAARTVAVRNALGTATTTTLRAQTLCVPSLNSTAASRTPAGASPERVLDHLRCYGVGTRASARPLTLRDQFGRTSTRVLRLVRLCNPVSKTYRGRARAVARPHASLACYAVAELRRFRVRTVAVRNQFDRRRRLRALRAETLCLPSSVQVQAIAGGTEPVKPAPIPAPAQFGMQLTTTACTANGVLVHRLSGRTDPAREAGLQTTLSGPGLATPVAQAATVAADGTFSATATSPIAPGVYRWTASVMPPDGGVFTGAIETIVTGVVAPCPV